MLHSMPSQQLKYDEIFGTDASFVSSKLIKIPNRSFMPEGLVQIACQGKNLKYLNCRNNRVIGASIGFSLEDAVLGALGEFVERYSAAQWSEENIFTQSYRHLIENGMNVIPLNYIRPYAVWQYNSRFPFSQLSADDEIGWVKCKNIKSGTNQYIPAFMVYMPYQETRTSKIFMRYTSTGLSANDTIEKATISSFLECAERQAFSNFWYHQDKIPFLKYNAETILSKYPDNPAIQKLYNNNRIAITVFDLTELSQLETAVVVIYFQYKGRLMQSIGASSRFKKEDALIKAMLEAYQGIEYSLRLIKEEGNDHKEDFSDLDDFDKHFAFYNIFPELRESVPMLKEALSNNNFTKEIKEDANKITSFNDLGKLETSYVLAVDITPSDVNSLGYKVVRVITPEWALLTGEHSSPFLGNIEHSDKKELFLNLPHCFP
jgi:ribosomal protein S12 methylthiotransferase accessory factor